MRWHVQRMRDVGRDLGIALGRLERFFSKRGDIIRMDDVMRQPRMIGLFAEQLLQDCTCLPPRRVGLVGGLVCSSECEGVENLRLVVVGYFCVIWPIASR